MTPSEKRKLRYNTDPEYRERVLEQNRQSRKRNNHNELEAKRRKHLRETDPEWHRRAKAQSLAWKKKHVGKFEEIIQAAKDQPCTDCGIQHPYFCMEFDHVRGEKLFNISKSARRGRTVEELLAEIDKCEIRCVICHRKRHWGHTEADDAVE